MTERVEDFAATSRVRSWSLRAAFTVLSVFLTCRLGRLCASQGFQFGLQARDLGFGFLAAMGFLLINAPHVLELGLQIAHRLIHEEFLERPFFNVPRLILFEVMNVLNRTTQNCTLGLLARAIWNDASQFVDSFVDISASAAFNFFLYKGSMRDNTSGWMKSDEHGYPSSDAPILRSP